MSVTSHADDHGGAPKEPWKQPELLPIDPVTVLYIAGGITLIVLLGSLLFRQRFAEQHKFVAFLLVAIPVILATLYLTGATIYENAISVTNGPVHWHADYQVNICGKEVDMKNPQGLSNKIGTAEFHEHDDNRIHVEGTVLRWDDVRLGTYFSVIGGSLENGKVVYPGVNRTYEKHNGNLCNGQPGWLEVYVNGQRIENYSDYILYPSSQVPPGDCIIVTFDSVNRSSIKEPVCNTWKTRGWSYDSFERRPRSIGEMSWQ